MAEQEACASAVTEALAAAGESTDGADETRGESLLLPLLQGLLGGGGERLLAGLGAAGADVVADVRRSLARLRAALAPPTDHPQARALLTLADRLEDALEAADRLDGCRRKPRRRSRAARHTVGVTHEELAEARRLVDRDHLALDAEPLSQSSGAQSSISGANSTEEPATPERKQSVDESVSYHNAIASRQKPAPIQHSASFVDTPRVNRDACVVERRASGPKKPDFFRHSSADGVQLQQSQQPVQFQQPQPPKQQQQQQYQQQQQQYQQEQQYQQQQQQYQQQQQQYHQEQQCQQKQQYQQPQQPQQPAQYPQQPAQYPQQLPQPQQPPPPQQPQYQQQQPHPPAARRQSDAKSGIAAIANKFNSQAQERVNEFPRRVPQRRRSPPPVAAPTVTQKLVREDPKRAPLYKPLPPTYNFAAPPPAEELSKPLNRFSNNKRLRMKRANTIDIGRPLAGYRLDSDTDDDLPRGPAMPKFQPQTDNDRKFVAFMRKNEENQVTVNGQSNWSNRFGNIKNTFESRERDDHSRSSSSSSARRFWRATDESPSPSAPRPRKFLADVTNNNTVKPPWTMEKREPRAHAAPHVQIPPPAPLPPPALPPPVPQSPTRPVVVKPFVAKPIPVNQFSHAPMSAFKPPTKITSPINAPSLVWSPPSVLNNTVSPTTEPPPPMYGTTKPMPSSPTVQNVPWATPETEKPRRIVNNISKFESPPPPPNAPMAPPTYREKAYMPNPPTPPTHAPPQIQSYPVKAIPSQNNLAAPELVRKMDVKPYVGSVPFVPKVDAQKLQIEFYEKQIRERARHEPMTNGHSEPAERKPPAPRAYTVTDYTPNNVTSTFVPLQQTPDIEKARAHKVDYLPDVVMNEGERTDFSRSPISQPNQQQTYQIRGSPHANAKPSYAYQNGESVPDDGPTTEHGSVETRVMRGPVRGAATITAGVRTRNDEGRRGGAADNLKGVLDKFSSPKRDVIAQIERKKRETARSQVRVPVQNGLSPLPAHASPNPRPPAIEYESPYSPGLRSPALAASRESVSSESVASLGSSPLSRSGSWHQIPDRSPKPASPRKVVARAKSMHLLAVPKMFEGGIARDELNEKKKSVEAYFSGQTAPAVSVTTSTSRSHAASVRARAARSSQAFSLGRSRTMPTVSELQFLDESNADDAFEDLVSALA